MKETKNIVKTYSTGLIYLGLCMILFSIVLFSMLGEKVPRNAGAGWDGVYYRDVMYNFSSEIFNHHYDRYRIQRILPFAVLNIVYNVIDIKKTDASLMDGIQILNFINLIFAVIFFYRISRQMNLKNALVIIGFSAFFLNYPILKNMGYFPFSTDPFALTFALMQFYYFIAKKDVSLVIVSIFGAFIWPTLLVCGLILAFLPRQELVLAIPEKKIETIILITAKVLFTIIVPVLFLYVIIRGKELAGPWLQGWFNITINWFFVTGAVITTPVYIWFLLKPVNISISVFVKDFIKNVSFVKIVLLIGIFAVVTLVQYYLSDKTTVAPFYDMLIGRIFIPSLQAPWAFLVFNFSYYGLIVILMCFYWDVIVKTYAGYGMSFCLIITFALMMSVNTESRHLMSFIPFLFFPFLKELNDNYKSTNAFLKFSIIFLAFSLIWSRFWFRMNVVGLDKALEEYTHTEYEPFPAQRIMISGGPWTIYPVYSLLLLVCIICAVLLFVYLKRMKNIMEIAKKIHFRYLQKFTPFIDFVENPDSIGKKLYRIKEETTETVCCIDNNDVLESSELKVHHPAQDILELNDVSVFGGSDIVKTSNGILWDKKYFHNFSPVILIPGDSNLLSYNEKGMKLKESKQVLLREYCFSMLGVHAKHWAHFLAQYLPKLFYMKESGLLKNDITILLPCYKDSQIMEIIDNAVSPYKNIKIEYIDDNTEVRCKKLIYIPSASILGDYGVSCSFLHALIPQTVIDVLKIHLVNPLLEKVNAVRRGDKIFLSRKGKNRNLINYEEIEGYFEKKGFSIVEPHLLKLEEKVNLFHNASIIVGPFGSAFTNLLFCSKGTKVLLFAPIPRIEDPYIHTLIKDSGIQMSCLIGRNSGIMDVNHGIQMFYLVDRDPGIFDANYFLSLEEIDKKYNELILKQG
jgi:hypothetical protein